MFSFLKKIMSNNTEKWDKEISDLYLKLKTLYNYDSIDEDRKKYLKDIIEENGYLPYPYIKALEELSEAEILFGMEIKWKNNAIFKDDAFVFENENLSPAKRAGYTNGDWLKREQHNIKLINLAGLGDGNKTQETGKLIDWLRQVLILPCGNEEKNILGTTIYLIPFHPREFGCAYLPVSSEVSPHLEDKTIKDKLGIDVKEQVQLFIKLAKLAGHCVIYDVLPQTGRFSKMVLSNPQIARWFDVNELITKIETEADKVAESLISDVNFDKEDIEIVRDIYKTTLKKGSNDLSEHYQYIYDSFEEIISKKKKKFYDEIKKKENQTRLHKRVREIVEELNDFKQKKDVNE